MIIAVTGSNGSLGGELVPFLKDLGHRVLVITSSNFSTSKIDVFTYSDLLSKKIPFKVDLFFHLASINSKLKENQIKDEVRITSDILSALPSISCKRLIFFSTSKVYGDNSLDINSFHESSPLNPMCHYGKAKKICEDLICSKSLDGELNALIFRMPPVLNKSDSSNIGKLINLSKTPIPIISIAQGDFNKRSFISFENIKIVINKILENIEIFKNSEIYNLSDDRVISLNELLSIAGKKKIYSLPMIFGKFLFFVPFLKNVLLKLFGNFVLDNSKLKSNMGVKLKTTAQLLKAKDK
tara:strand:+ start:253 stop:1143 length:891 start_codon:yes stop_codon:yes gene_type:complete